MQGIINRLIVVTALVSMPSVGAAQTTSPSLNGTQSVVPLSQQATTLSETAAAGGTAAGTQAQVAPGINTAVSSSIGKSFGTVGRGLPGFPGGPPINSTPGGGDTPASLTRPQTIPPLLCDPAVDIPC